MHIYVLPFFFYGFTVTLLLHKIVILTFDRDLKNILDDHNFQISTTFVSMLLL